MNVDDIIDQTIGHEGGFVNDPDDPGGATKYGITIGTLRAVRGRATVQDVRDLTRDEAVEIYRDRYFYRPRIDELPIAMQPTVFDMYVNAGGNAIKILQRLLSEFNEQVSVDGALGPQTISATERAYRRAGEFLVDAYGIARRNYYFRIADRRPQSRKYARRRDGGKGGWITRSEQFIRSRWHLTAAEFQRRVQAWG